MIKLKTSILHAGLLLCLCPALTAAQTYVGYVLDVEGTWHLNNDLTTSLAPGQKLPAFGAISVRSPSPADRIVVADMRGEIIAARDCSTDDCSKFFNLPRRAARRSALGEIFRTAMELIWGSPNRYSAHRSRGAQLADGVVKLDGPALDIGHLLAAEGTYYLRWRELPQAEGATRAWSRPSLVETRAGEPVTFSAEGLKPGLYEFGLLRSVGEGFEPVGSVAFVLVASPAQFNSSLASFNEATEMTRRWGSKVRPETAQLYLRAHLDGIARRLTEGAR